MERGVDEAMQLDGRTRVRETSEKGGAGAEPDHWICLGITGLASIRQPH
jgi:hypothetical protein